MWKCIQVLSPISVSSEHNMTCHTKKTQGNHIYWHSYKQKDAANLCDECKTHSDLQKGVGWLKTGKDLGQMKWHSLSSKCNPQKPYLHEFICLFWKKGISMEKNKIKHKMLHTDGKQHECNHCFTQFTHRHALIKHLQRRHILKLVWDTIKREYC